MSRSKDDRSAEGFGDTVDTGARGRMATGGGMAIVPGMMIADYKVERLIGEGGMGVVVGAIHPVIGKRAAIKILRAELCANPQVVARFVAEARAVNQIGHPNIIDVFAFGRLDDGRQYLIMEWLAGESLADRLRKGPLSWSETIDILDQVAVALGAAHEARIVHRDLKPDNVFLVERKDGESRQAVKLLDFGIAKLDGDDVGGLEKTRTGSLMGTPAYMSPEQARGRGVDARTDLYALGAMAFELVTSRPPFMADNAADMIAKHLNAPPPSMRQVVPHVPAALDELAIRLLDKDAAQRPGLGEVRKVLAELRSTDSRALTPIPGALHTMVPQVQAVGAAPVTMAPTPARSGRPWLLPLVLLVLAAGGITLFVLTRKHEPVARPAPTPVQQPSPSPPPPVEPQPTPPVQTPPVQTPPVHEVQTGSLKVANAMGTGTLTVGDRTFELKKGSQVLPALPVGSFDASFAVNGKVVARKKVTIKAGETADLRLSRKVEAGLGDGLLP